MTSPEESIMTVLGPVSPEQIGPTYMHEHLILDNSFSGWDPNKSFTEEDVAIWEMNDSYRAGARAVVEMTCTGLGAAPAALRRIAQATRVSIIASTGFYRHVNYPDYVTAASVDDLAELMIDHCRRGFDDSGVRPGMLGEFASHDPKTPGSVGHGPSEPPNNDVEKVFRAAGRVHATTGLPITTHCFKGIGADWEIEVFKSEGVDLSKVIIGHVVAWRPELDHVRWILDQGVNIAIDTIGYGDRDDMDFCDHQKAHLIRDVVHWGHIDQVTISLDMTRKYHLKKYGGHGFAYLMDCFLPLLREVGLTDQQVDQIIIGNPRRILTPAR